MVLNLEKPMLKQIFLIVICILLAFNPNSSFAANDKPSVDVQEIFTSSKTIEGESFEYPAGKAELRLIRVEVEKGATIPMHSHPIPLMGHIESGQLTLKKKLGDKKTFKKGDSFILAANTPPHTMGNTGDSSAIMWVAVASAEGLPTLNAEE